jgi:hypothetical protein
MALSSWDVTGGCLAILSPIMVSTFEELLVLSIFRQKAKIREEMIKLYDQHQFLTCCHSPFKGKMCPQYSLLVNFKIVYIIPYQS